MSQNTATTSSSSFSSSWHAVRMDQVRRAAYHNSTGASLLAAGDTKKACKSFKSSLQVFARLVAQLGDDQPPPQEANPDEVKVLWPVPRSPMASPDTETSPENQGQPYLYSKAMVFYPNSTITSVDLTFYVSVVVFNLLVTYQTTKKNPQGRDLKKIFDLYELCLRLISESAKSMEYDCAHLVVATLNNKSVLLSELGQHTLARRMLYHVWDVMQYPQRRPEHLEQSEVEGIFLNIFLILVNAPYVAGAA
ncbi:expressed unknown protein [Seminavis robusta]|uniref:Uncharacterized protein n=1 Tax=Seminavis robusta TaxID=568900 RepID=A0A9N8HE97_9STRA|nr:expressed unknown protein [Seminavis robusta]|eukprot:Sro394_g133810.1 n/a (250) ;mRNA; f:24832-25581